MVQILFSMLGVVWIIVLGPVTRRLAALPDDAWRTHLLDNKNDNDNDINKTTNDVSTTVKRDSGVINTTNTPTTGVFQRKGNTTIDHSGSQMGAMESGVSKNDHKQD